MLGNDAVKQVFEEADNVRIKLGLDLITPVCVLTALQTQWWALMLTSLKSFPVKERELLDLYISNEEINMWFAPGDTVVIKKYKVTTALYKYCVDRIALARRQRQTPLLAATREGRMIMEILSRRTKPNVIITGDAGVGKTALVDGFALDIVNNLVPEFIKNTAV
jgi:ATP-dependent Clp protease ATP-binding subunit ClpB